MPVSWFVVRLRGLAGVEMSLCSPYPRWLKTPVAVGPTITGVHRYHTRTPESSVYLAPSCRLLRNFLMISSYISTSHYARTKLATVTRPNQTLLNNDHVYVHK